MCCIALVIKNILVVLRCRQLGESWTVTTEVKEQLELFTCFMYGKPRETSVNVVRSKLLKDIFEKPEPDSESQGWLRSDDGVLEPVWSIGPILPPSLLKLLDTCDTENDNDENDCIDAEPNLEDDVEIDYDDMLTEDDY